MKVVYSTSRRLVEKDMKRLGVTMANLDWICIGWMLVGEGANAQRKEHKGTHQKDYDHEPVVRKNYRDQ